MKKNLSDPSKRKLLKQKNANVASGDTGFAKYSGGPQAFVGLDPSKWRLKKYRFDGKSKCEVTGSLEEINAPIKEGVIQFITSPITYLAMMFQTNMTQYATEKQKYTLLNRMGTYQYRPQGTMDADDPNAKGVFTLLMWTYQNLPPFPNNELPMQARDQYTDDMTYQGQKLHYKTPDDVPVLPGRGMVRYISQCYVTRNRGIEWYPHRHIHPHPHSHLDSLPLVLVIIISNFVIIVAVFPGDR